MFAAEQAHIPPSLQTTALRDQRKLLTNQIQSWEPLRMIYMPGLFQIQTDLGANSAALWQSNPIPEDVDIWLPSSVTSNRRGASCIEGLPEMELKLRTAQCSSSLQGLRQTLRVKTRMIYFKNKNIRGQREGTRSRAIIDRVHKRAIRFVQKYRAARKAKMALEGPGDWQLVFQELKNEDIRGFSSAKPRKQPLRRGIWEDGHAPVLPDNGSPHASDSSESESDPDLNDGSEAGPRPRKKRKRGTGETRKALSWIWQTLPMAIDGANTDDDILRAEWARSRARCRRANEEVSLVREEMRRVLKFLEWNALRWELRQDGRDDLSLEHQEGVKSFALGQAALHRHLSVAFLKLWKIPLVEIDTFLKAQDPQEVNVDSVEQPPEAPQDEDVASDDEAVG